jgi:hypothetical protein
MNGGHKQGHHDALGTHRGTTKHEGHKQASLRSVKAALHSMGRALTGDMCGLALACLRGVGAV